MKQLMFMVLAMACVTGSVHAQTPHPSKVDLSFNHWYDFDQLTDALRKLTRAYPKLLKMESIGKEGVGDTRCIETNNWCLHQRTCSGLRKRMLAT